MDSYPPSASVRQALREASANIPCQPFLQPVLQPTQQSWLDPSLRDSSDHDAGIQQEQDNTQEEEDGEDLQRSDVDDAGNDEDDTAHMGDGVRAAMLSLIERLVTRESLMETMTCR